MTQACCYLGGSALATNVNFFCLFYWFRFRIVLSRIQVIYADIRAITLNSQNVFCNHFFRFRYCLFAQMYGLDVALPDHGLVCFNVPNSCGSREFYCETVNCRDHISLLHQGSSNDCIVG